MTQPPDPADIAALARTLLLGTRKAPVKLPPSAALLLPSGSSLPPAMLALVLVGQSQRFERPSAPALGLATQKDRAVYADPRPMLSDVSRRLLKQLLALAKGDTPELLFQACRERVAARGLRLHPFDMPGFGAYLRASEITDVAYQGKTGEAASLLLDAESWKALPPEQRGPALHQLRHTSPDAARALLEATFRSETPQDRRAFLGVLAVDLSVADMPFLESAAKDRAEGVRDVAAMLLGRIPGTDGYRTRVARAAQLFVSSDVGGNTGRSQVLSMGKGRLHHEIVGELEGVKLADLAECFSLSSCGFIEALAFGKGMLSTDKDVLTAALLPSVAAADSEGALAATFIRQFSGLPALVKASRNWAFGKHLVKKAPPLLVEALIDLAIADAFPDAPSLHALYQMVRAPLSEPIAAKLLASESWRTYIARLAAPEADNKTPNAVKEAALLIPDSLLGAFLAAISPLSPHITLPARLFAEFCQSLAETTPVAPLKPSS